MTTTTNLASLASSAALNTTSSTASATAGTSSTSNADSEQRFLKLLVTQLNNQDPLNPMQNAELTSQLAQMSTVSGIEKMNTTLSGLMSQGSASQVLQAASLIGTNVLAPGNTLTAGSGTAPFAVDLAAAAAQVKVTITDAAGTAVRTYDAGAMAQGVHGLTWDGKDDSGAAVAAGNYQVQVTAANGSAGVASTALTVGQVNSVKQGATGVSLDLGGGRTASLSDVRNIL
ncbi:flagellar hook assembly protein FlgD [Variovorax ginsengisoli]|uniref:Basal-body rod modification protein FlgD n=1 Tax=Variovorax ginsengisoli TaxID=363844 RepID=A0ABT9SD46_9BURK|nr:flagellar hook assembly protein FlgD [Variovorax ginsengisoli]MDP9902275.1 flagellar basal-body rod modification protein FlgD [Variovorax ginsengisoli]